MQITCLICWITGLLTLCLPSLPRHHTTMQTLTCWIIRLVTLSLPSLPCHHTTMQTTCLTCWIIRLVTESVFSALASHYNANYLSHLSDHQAGVLQYYCSPGSAFSTLAPYYSANCLTCWIIRLVTPSLSSLPWHHTTMQITSHLSDHQAGVLVLLWYYCLPGSTFSTLAPHNANCLTRWIIRLGFIRVCLLRF